MDIIRQISDKLSKIFKGSFPAEFVFSDRAKKDSKSIAKKHPSFADDLADLVSELHSNSGALIPNSGGARKVRMASETKGSSGSYRIIVYTLIKKQMHIIHIYQKSDKSDLSQADLKMIRGYIKDLKS